MVLPEANYALLFQHLADKCSTDSQLIFNIRKIKRHFTPGEMGERWGRLEAYGRRKVRFYQRIT